MASFQVEPELPGRRSSCTFLGFAAQVPTIPVPLPRTAAASGQFPARLRSHRESTLRARPSSASDSDGGIPARPESGPVKMILAWKVATRFPFVGLFRAGLEVSSLSRKILTANLPPFYRVLPEPSGYLGTPQHISTLSTNSLITNYLTAQVFVFLGAPSVPIFPGP